MPLTATTWTGFLARAHALGLQADQLQLLVSLSTGDVEIRQITTSALGFATLAKLSARELPADWWLTLHSPADGLRGLMQWHLDASRKHGVKAVL